MEISGDNFGQALSSHHLCSIKQVQSKGYASIIAVWVLIYSRNTIINPTQTPHPSIP